MIKNMRLLKKILWNALWLGILLFLAITAFDVWKRQKAFLELQRMLINQKVAPFALWDTKDRLFSFPSDFVRAQEWTVINFWQTTCLYCREEVSEWNKFAAAALGRNVIFLSINVGNSLEDIERFRASLQVSYPLYYDKDGKLAKSFRVLGTPATFVLDSHLVVREVFWEPVDDELLVRTLEVLRDGKGNSP